MNQQSAEHNSRPNLGYNSRVETDPDEVYCDSEGGLAERRHYLETHLVERLYPSLPAAVRIKASTRALLRRIECVKDLKRRYGEPDWNWSPGDPLPEDDDIVQAFLGFGTWYIFLAEEICFLRTGIHMTDDRLPEIERLMGIDARGVLRARLKNRVSWWTHPLTWALPRPRSHRATAPGPLEWV